MILIMFGNPYSLMILSYVALLHASAAPLAVKEQYSPLRSLFSYFWLFCPISSCLLLLSEIFFRSFQLSRFRFFSSPCPILSSHEFSSCMPEYVSRSSYFLSPDDTYAWSLILSHDLLIWFYFSKHQLLL